MFGKKRLLIAASGLTAIGATAAMVAGVTFGLFSSTPSTGAESNSFTAGTLTLTQAATAPCTITNMAPGDTDTCTFTVTYAGSSTINAYVGLDITTSSGGLFSTSFAGDDNPLTFTVTDPGAFSVTSAGNDLLVSAAAFTPSESDTFTVKATLPLLAGNDYQGLSGTIGLTAFAVQSANNPDTGCAVGVTTVGETGCSLVWS